MGGSNTRQLVPLGMPLPVALFSHLLLACLTLDARAVVQQVALADRGRKGLDRACSWCLLVILSSFG